MTPEFEFLITKEQSGVRLDQFLCEQKDIAKTRSQVQKLIEGGFVFVNGEAPKSSYKLKFDDRVKIEIPAPKELEAKPENIPLDVVYEDSDLIVVNKPKGLVVHPAAGNYTGTLVNALLFHCNDLSGIGGVVRPGIVHRLDKDTSGLIVVAKNDFTHQALAVQFQEKQIKKIYLALVHGKMKQDQGVIEGKLGRHPKHRKRMAVVSDFQPWPKGREAVTKFWVIERYAEYTLVELTLETGRTHQIRVHLTSLGHAIVGDPIYGHRLEKFNVKGQLLHAAKLGFTHPRSGKYVEFEAGLPREMDRIIKILQAR
ncbi:MAG: RluA family pseudouridine synthase [bacterium]